MLVRHYETNPGVDHLPSILNSAAEATSTNLKSLAQHSKEKVYKLTSAFEKLIYTEAGKDAAPKDIDQVLKDKKNRSIFSLTNVYIIDFSCGGASPTVDSFSATLTRSYEMLMPRVREFLIWTKDFCHNSPSFRYVMVSLQIAII